MTYEVLQGRMPVVPHYDKIHETLMLGEDDRVLRVLPKDLLTDGLNACPDLLAQCDARLGLSAVDGMDRIGRFIREYGGWYLFLSLPPNALG